MTWSSKKPAYAPEPQSDDKAAPLVCLTMASELCATALNDLTDPSKQADNEVLAVRQVDGKIEVEFSHRYNRRTALHRRLSSLLRAGVEVQDFVWLDAMTDPDERWLHEALASFPVGPEALARRLERLAGQEVLTHLIDRMADTEIEDRQRRTIAHAAALTAFNTHTTEAGNNLVVAGAELADTDRASASRLLDGASEIARLGRFGVLTEIDERPLITLVEHRNWEVYDSATKLLASLAAPRSEEATDVLVRLARKLATGSKSTEVRAEQVIDALASAPDTRSDVDEALDELRSHVHSGVRVAATALLARRQPQRARGLWEPWLHARSFNERNTAEWMICTYGDETDVTEVVRIVNHRTKPPKGRTYFPPLSADGLAFLAKHSHVPDAATALGRVRNRWDLHDTDLRNWLKLHHPQLVPEEHR